MLNSSFLKVSFYCINCAELLVLSHSNPLMNVAEKQKSERNIIVSGHTV